MRKYTGRVQWFTVKEEALDLLGKGYSYTLLHEKLAKEGRVTMSYKTFYGYASAAYKESLKQPAQKKQPTAPRRLGVGSNDSLINHAKNPQREDLI
jgi:hypothetical protein